MRGVCNVNVCESARDKYATKIHEAFEGLEDFNICWSCGDKIIEAIELTTSEIEALKNKNKPPSYR